MPRITLDNGRFRATIDPQLGGGIAEFSVRSGNSEDRPILRTAPPQTTWFNDLACYVLAPWSNRIRNAEFSWCGKTYHLRADWPDGTAIHGLVKDQPFRIVERSPVSIRLIHDYSPQHADVWPWPFRCDVRYELASHGLRTRLRLTSMAAPESGSMPAGVGFHPFFPRGEADEPVAIQYRGVGRYPAEAMIPVAPPRVDDVTAQLAAAQSLGMLALDDVFLGGTDGAEIRWRTRSVRFRCSINLGHAVIYTGKPDAAGRMPAFCFEPVTMVNDGFNLHARGWADTGVCALAAGQSLEVTWDLDVCD